MLLHTFHVDTGTMIKFDINLALESVSKLKEEIERKCGIPIDKQVLLASGGHNLEPNERVGTYIAGTDTCPIFLFSKTAIEGTVPPLPTVDYGPDIDMKSEVATGLELPPTINTVKLRYLLAQKFRELADEQLKICENLVHDQHLQQQGWAAVVANLDDIIFLFKSRSENFKQNFRQHLETRDQYIEILRNFENDLDTLNKIPVLPALLESESEENQAAESLTLLQWISAQDQQASLQQVADQCRKGINQFDADILENLIGEATKTIDAASGKSKREIGGLEERLYGLDRLCCDAKLIVRDQTDLANALAQNQNSVTNLGGDESILPDLCRSHKHHLNDMLRNHDQLRDIRARCAKAKEELAANLLIRLKWVMLVENKVQEVDGRMLMYHESVKKLGQHLEVLEQLHTAPSMYLSAVAEVVRRRTFSQAFLSWGNEVSCQVCSVHSEEVERRKQFHSQFQGHFLFSLFPGLDDLPPQFATHPPPLFDSHLPKLCHEDIEALKRQLPDMALSLSVPDLSSVTQFFLIRSKSGAALPTESINKLEVGGLSSNIDGVGLLQPTDNSQSSAQSATQPISDRYAPPNRGFESETDTEDLEGVNPSHSEVPLLKKGRKRKDEGVLVEAKKINMCKSAVGGLRADMAGLKEWVLSQRNELDGMFANLTLTCLQQNEAMTKELEMKRNEVDHLRSLSARLEEQLKTSLVREEAEREQRMQLTEKIRQEVDQRLQLAQQEREERERLAEEVRRETTERLLQVHNAEVDAIKNRCKLLQSISTLERSTSESNLERTLKGDSIDKAEHQTLLNHLREELLQEKNKEVKELQAQFESKVKELKFTSEQATQSRFNEAIRRVVNEKDNELEKANQRILILETKLQVYETTFSSQPQSMEESEQEKMISSSSPQTSLTHISSSISIVPESRSHDVTTSPGSSPSSKTKDKMKNMTVLHGQGKINIDSCKEGDHVLVMWNDQLNAYTVLQESSNLHFLHRDSVEKLALHEINPRIPWRVGEVIHKEYCQAKKAGNRYNMPVGSKFYRVKVEPIGSINRKK